MTDFELLRRRLAERPELPSLQIEPARVAQAAVVLILRAAPDVLEDTLEALIIKRAERDGDPWSGHLALPGGRAEAVDVDLLATAARETHEEIGLELLAGDGARDRFIGQLPLLAPRNPRLPRIEIMPFVALAPAELNLRLSAEVDDVFWLSINQLKREGRTSEYRMQLDQVVKKWPAYASPSGPIWGITERILTDFLELLD